MFEVARPARCTWPTDQGWYDVEVTTAEDPTYRRRLSGHLETGRPSITG